MVHGKGAKGKICLLLAYQLLALVRDRILARMGKQVSWERHLLHFSQQKPFSKPTLHKMVPLTTLESQGIATSGSSSLQQ